MVSAVSRMFQQKIISEVKEAKFFAVCADEAVDSSTKEQLPLILRFIIIDMHGVTFDIISFDNSWNTESSQKAAFLLVSFSFL